MKTIVSLQEISELEIKPRAAVEQWRRLLEEDLGRRWPDRSGWIRVSCPGCGGKEASPAFDRYGFSYVECAVCGSLYASSRPGEAELSAWYRDSKPSLFFREAILPASQSPRLEKILRPRADWILDGIAEYNPTARKAIDISPHSRGLIDLLASDGTGLEEIVAAGATADLEGGVARRVEVQPTPLAGLAGLGAADVILATDIMNRAADPDKLLRAIETALAPGGLVFATLTVASGFEIQTLWEKSPSVIPPDKLNLPTVMGIEKMFGDPMWEILETSTPGLFDVELVRQVIQAEHDEPWPRVVRALVERTDAAGRMALIELLQALRLTSFARVVVRRTI